MLSDFRFIITCEHASPEIPGPWNHVLAPFCKTCEPHQIWDPGTSEIGSSLARRLDAPVFKGEHTRLLVDLNRAEDHPTLFCPLVRDLPERDRENILQTYYRPFREETLQMLNTLLAGELPVIHLSIHSFTPIYDGHVRDADFGLLFDPQVPTENELARRWLDQLRAAQPDLICRENYPYLGTDDGHAPALRKRFPSDHYLGFELEFNQNLPLTEKADAFAGWICQSLQQALAGENLRSFLPSASRPAPTQNR